MQEEIRKIKHIFITAIDEISLKTIALDSTLLGDVQILLFSQGLTTKDKIFDEKDKGIIFRREVEIPDYIYK